MSSIILLLILTIMFTSISTIHTMSTIRGDTRSQAHERKLKTLPKNLAILDQIVTISIETEKSQ